MLGWFVSLFLTLLFALGAATPGALEARLGDELTRRLGGSAHAVVHLEGDPVLQWPRGEVPSASAHVTGLVVEGLPLRTLDLTVREVRFDPLAALTGRRFVLRGPAPATVALAVAPEALQTRLDAATAALGDGSSVRVQLGEGRLSLQGRLPRFFVLPVRVETGFALDVAGTVRFEAPVVHLNGARMPGLLAAPALAQAEGRLNDALPRLLPEGWRLTSLTIRPDGLAAAAAGDAGALSSLAEELSLEAPAPVPVPAATPAP